MKPNIIFFSRDYQTKLFPLLSSDKYESFFVTLTVLEKRQLEKKNIVVSFCFEEEYSGLITTKDDETKNIETSFFSDRFFCRHSLNDRNKILSKEFAFWDKVFRAIKPSFIINEVIAIEIAEVMFIKAKEYNIEYLAWMISPFPDKFFYWLSNPFHASLNREIFSTTISLNSMDISKKYLNTFKSEVDNKPFYAKNLKSRFSFIKTVEMIGGYFRTNTINRFKNIPKLNFLREYYGFNDSTSSKINHLFCSILYSYNYRLQLQDFEIVFYPLHFEPEASIIYFSEFNEDQPALIRNISKCLKRNQLLVIKEHPQQPGMLLSKPFRELRKRLSNILYLPSEFSTKKLIEMSKIIITQTSTAGWEAILLEKPVFVLGKVFYDNYKYVNKFYGFEKLRETIANEDYLYPNNEETLIFIAQFWDYCEYGNPYPNKNLFSKENIKKLVSAIETKVMQTADTSK